MVRVWFLAMLWGAAWNGMSSAATDELRGSKDLSFTQARTFCRDRLQKANWRALVPPNSSPEEGVVDYPRPLVGTRILGMYPVEREAPRQSGEYRVMCGQVESAQKIPPSLKEPVPAVEVRLEGGDCHRVPFFEALFVETEHEENPTLAEAMEPTFDFTPGEPASVSHVNRSQLARISVPMLQAIEHRALAELEILEEGLVDPHTRTDRPLWLPITTFQSDGALRMMNPEADVPLSGPRDVLWGHGRGAYVPLFPEEGDPASNLHRYSSWLFGRRVMVVVQDEERIAAETGTYRFHLRYPRTAVVGLSQALPELQQGMDFFLGIPYWVRERTGFFQMPSAFASFQFLVEWSWSELSERSPAP